EMKSDPMSDKTDGLESQLVKLFEKRLIDLSAASAWLDHVHHKILACDQIRPNLLLLCSSLSDHGGATNAGQVTILLTEDLHADQIPFTQFTFRRPDIGNLAYHTRRDDHQLVIFRASNEEPAEQQAGKIHFAHPDFCLTQRVTDGLVGKFAQRTKQRQLVGSFDLTRLVKNRIGRDP